MKSSKVEDDLMHDHLSDLEDVQVVPVHHDDKHALILETLSDIKYDLKLIKAKLKINSTY